MSMIGEECPGKTIRLRLGEDITEALSKIIPVLIIKEYPPAFNSAHDDMMQGPGSIDASLAWHSIFISHDPQL
jgi:hypothetical protein